MHCQHCGALNDDDATSCESCGAPCDGAEPLNPYAAPNSPPPNACGDYLVLNIVATLFCCPFCGIGGVTSSILARAAKRRGDWERAKEESEYARMAFWVSVGMGLLYGVPAVLYLLLC